MANYYTMFSAALALPKGTTFSATRTVADKAAADWCLQNDQVFDATLGLADWYGTVDEPRVVFNSKTCDDLEMLIDVAQALLDAFEISEPFVLTWANVCDKQKLDGFSGGACVLQAGKEPHWIDASRLAAEYVKSLKETKEGDDG